MFARRLVAPLAAVIILSSVVSSRSARAESTEALVREGLAHFEKSQYAAARASFAAAYARAPTTATLLNLALAEVNAGAFLDALRHFRQYVNDPRAKRDKVARIADELIPRAYRATGHLRVDAAPETTIAIDGTALPDASGVLDVAPGKHAVDLKLGSRVTHLDVEAPAGEVVVLRVVPVVPVAEPGRLAPCTASTASAPCAATTSTTLAVPGPASRARDVPAAAPSTPFWTTRTAVGLSLGLGAVATGVAGAAFLVASNDAAGTAAALRSGQGSSVCAGSPSATCPAFRDAVDSQYAARGRATGFFVAAGALGAASLGAFLFWPEAKRRTAWLSPAVAAGPGAVAGGVAGAF